MLVLGSILVTSAGFGVVSAAVLALAAVGFTLQFAVSNVLNLAYGAVMIVAGAFITVLPMLGDYFTNQLLSAAPGTTMIGNGIEGLLQSPGQTGQGAVLALFLLAVLLIPMVYYVVSTARASTRFA